MSGSTKSVEIEDVLSSIRRLVSEHQAQRGTLAQVREDAAPESEAEVAEETSDGADSVDFVRPEAEDAADHPAEAEGPVVPDDQPAALILTPALRVSSPEDPWSAIGPAAAEEGDEDEALAGDGHDWAEAAWGEPSTDAAPETDANVAPDDAAEAEASADMHPEVGLTDAEEAADHAPLAAEASLPEPAADMEIADDIADAVGPGAAADPVADDTAADDASSQPGPHDAAVSGPGDATDPGTDDDSDADADPTDAAPDPHPGQQDNAPDGDPADQPEVASDEPDLGHVLHLVNADRPDDRGPEMAEPVLEQFEEPFPETGGYEPVGETADWDRDGAGNVVASLAAVRSGAGRGNLAGLMAAERAHLQAHPEVADDQPEGGITAPDTDNAPAEGQEQAGDTAEAEADRTMAENATAPRADDTEIEDLGNDFVSLEEDDGTEMMDEDALRDLIAEVVRQELQGAMGERITRNIRKLVRREIRTLLAAEHFE